MIAGCDASRLRPCPPAASSPRSLLAALIREYGPCQLAAAQRADHFSALVRAIVFQQLSTKAASTIYSRMVASLPNGELTPHAFTVITDDQLRAAGISRQKGGYLRDLCDKVLSGVVPLEALETMDDEQVIATLTTIKGIGRWSAEMFLMFRLHRPDVLPVGDLGIVNAVKKVYGLRKKPTPDRLQKDGRGVETLPIRRVLVPLAQPGQRPRTDATGLCQSCKGKSSEGA